MARNDCVTPGESDAVPIAPGSIVHRLLKMIADEIARSRALESTESIVPTKPPESTSTECSADHGRPRPDE